VDNPTSRAPTSRGAMPQGGTFRGGGTFGEKRNSKWSFMNEPEVRGAALFDSPLGGTSHVGTLPTSLRIFIPDTGNHLE